MKDIYAKLLPGYPLQEMSALIEQHAERTGMQAIPQFFLVGVVPMVDGGECPYPVGPFRYTAKRALEDWRDTPGAGVSFIIRWFDPGDPDAMAAHQRHKEAQAMERAQMGLAKP